MHIASKETTHAQTVKLTPVTGHPEGHPTGAICKHPSVKTDQTARISLQIPVMSKSKRQNQQSAPTKRPPPILNRNVDFPVAIRPSSAPLPRPRRFGETVFTDSRGESQGDFSKKWNFPRCPIRGAPVFRLTRRKPAPPGADRPRLPAAHPVRSREAPTSSAEPADRSPARRAPGQAARPPAPDHRARNG